MPTSEDGLDFSGLSDDQIVEMAVGLAREAMRRNPALEAAFAQALLDERERVEAARRGTEQARKDEARRIETQAKAAEGALVRERERRRVHDALAGYLRQASTITGIELAELVLVWETRSQIRRPNPRLRLALGPMGARSNWFLVDYGVPVDEFHASPGMRARGAALLAWCREAAAAFTALGIERTMELKGIEVS